MLRYILLTLVGLMMLSGCTAKLTEPELDFEPPAYVEQMPAHEDERNYVSTGSIFGQGDNPLFSDHKAMRVHDIVKVVISETASSSNAGKKQLSESDTAALGGGAFTTAGGNPAVSAYAGHLSGLTNIGYNSTSNSSFNGQGSATKDTAFTTTVSARVVKVLQNGNYFISGKREILIDDQKQIIQIAGVIRAYDINQNNEINSAQMSEAKILYSSEGDIDRAMNQGWGTKIVQAVWPF